MNPFDLNYDFIKDIYLVTFICLLHHMYVYCFPFHPHLGVGNVKDVCS